VGANFALRAMDLKPSMVTFSRVVEGGKWIGEVGTTRSHKRKKKSKGKKQKGTSFPFKVNHVDFRRKREQNFFLVFFFFN